MLKSDGSRYVIICDNCGRSNRIKKVNISPEVVQLASSNNIYCQYCGNSCRDKNKAALLFSASMSWLVEQPFADLSDEEIAAIARAKLILNAGIEKLKKEKGVN